MNINFKIVLIVVLIVGGVSITSAKERQIVISKFEKNPERFGKVKLIVSKLKRDDIYKTLVNFIKHSRPNRFFGSTGHKKSSEFIIDFLKRNKGSDDLVWIDDFVPDINHAIKFYNKDFETQIVGRFSPNSIEYKKNYRFTKSITANLKNIRHLKGKNIIWERRGKSKPDEIIVLGAHLDTILSNQNTSTIGSSGTIPGADNNGSGVIILLNLIKILSKMDLQKTVRIVFFDFETLGFLGSREFVKKYQKELLGKGKKMAGFINLLMLGHDSKRQDRQHKYGNLRIYIRKKNMISNTSDNNLAQMIAMNSKKIISGINFEILPNNFQVGSNINFWEKDIPAVVVSQNWEDDPNPWAQTSNDLIETLNLRTLYKAYQHISIAVISWAFDINR